MRSIWSLPPVFYQSPDNSAADLRSYFLGRLADDSGPLFTGSMFEKIIDEPDTPNRFTPADLLAVSMLSVDVPARVSIALLGPAADKASTLLAGIPTDLDLAAAEPSAVGRQSSSWALWNLLMAYDEVGPTTASKLIARKRPRLIPVQDSVVVATLKHPKGADFWASMRTTLQETVGDGMSLSNWLGAARDTAGIDPGISELRVFDVLVWRHGKRA
jgi:hypothetical protein